jgi:hypothetical protein
MLVEEKACTACYVVMTINRQINFIRLFVNLCAVTFLVLKKHQYMFKCGNKFCKKKKIKNIEGMLIVLSLHKTELVM